MPYGTAENERLGHIFHFDCAWKPSVDVELFERAFECHAVDHSREHPHIICGGPIHAAAGSGEAAPNITATNDDRDLNAERLNLFDPLGDFAHHFERNVLARSAFLERFAA